MALEFNRVKDVNGAQIVYLELECRFQRGKCDIFFTGSDYLGNFAEVLIN